MTSENHTDFIFPIRVYYEDTDAGGVVFYANYLKFFERARTEWLRHLGLHQSVLVEQANILFVVTYAQLDYKRPARLDDALLIKTQIKKIGKASIDFEQICMRQDEILVRCDIQIACVNAQTFKISPIPNFVHSILLSDQDN
ncbi:tol-pal system-associated acyl-CoA thioesterase [Pelistega sp. NLN82]|uniref:Tol-pal system-associated acyl-CoA thioesterase n=1 Tax=Pelistega ratti TaxID=2652177 RepID=A0A6L9Y8C9_9BURK|nr:tol-pal system-associated acyl-CoA thioesterase [Pelistega ratti]NEN76137.1 tol-pal system-associated acyl-CoA thioesterase [Pelistega ratti]